MKSILASWKALLISALCVCALPACKRQGPPPAQPPPEVATVVVAEQSIVLTVELPGRTSPFRIAEVRPQVSGLIQKRLFTEGSDVKEGQPLYQIDPAPFKATLENARAALARAEANVPAARVRVERYKQAIEQKAVSQQDYDDAAAALKQAEADVEFYKATVRTAGINLDYALVKSPISGRIGASSVTDGAIVTAYQPVALATIQQLDPMYVDVPQSATEALRLRKELEKGQISREGKIFDKVKLVLPDGSPYSEEGTLQFRDVSVDPTTGSIIMRMVFPNPGKVLLPGMFVRAVVNEASNPKAILVPQQTVSRDPKGNPLALVIGPDSKVEQRQLVLERAVGDKWVVASGLKPGERIIAEGMQKVRPGAVVKEVPFKEESAASTSAKHSGPAQDKSAPASAGSNSAAAQPGKTS